MTSTIRKRQRTAWRLLWIVALLWGLVFGLWLVLINLSAPFFPYSITHEKFHLRSDRPFSEQAATEVLAKVQTKLESSPFYRESDRYRVHIANSAWRRLLFFGHAYKVGGITWYPLSQVVYIRQSSIDANRVYTPEGKVITDDRPLDYFIAHELAHVMMGRNFGWLKHLRLPAWKREGYADYVGKGALFNFDKAVVALRANDAKMSYARSGLYWRYNLLVAYLLDVRQLTPQTLLSDRTLVPAAIEQEILQLGGGSQATGSLIDE